MTERSVTMFVRNDLRNDSRVWKEARLLDGAGWRVRLLGVSTSGQDEHETIDGISVDRLVLRPWDSRLLKRGRGAAAPVFETRPEAQRRPARALRLRELAARAYGPFHEEVVEREFVRRAVACVASAPTRVYHAHDLNAYGAAAEARSRFGGKVVLDHHEFYSERNAYRKPGIAERRWLRLKEGRAARRADLNVTVSGSIAEALKSRYRLANRPAVVMNCPEPSSAAPGPRLSDRLGGGVVLLYIGSATWNRGLEQVVDVLPQRGQWRLALLGSAQRGYREALEDRARRRGVAERVHFLGAVPAGEVVGVAAGADAAVLFIQNACLSYYYCSPNKLFEALAAGLRIAASDFPELRNVVASGEAGALCGNPADTAAVLTTIDAALAMPRDAVAVRARRLAERFSWTHEGAKLLAAYERLANQEASHV